METKHRESPWEFARLDSRAQAVLLVCLVAVLSYLTARLGGTLVIRPQTNWPLWPGNAILVSILLFVPRRIWPILIAAAFGTFVLYDLQTGVTTRSTALLILSDTVEVLTAALGLSYSFDGVPQLNSVKALARYSFFAGVLAPFTGAFIGALAANGNYWTSWRISFFSEAIAYFTVTPAILGWVGKARAWVRPSRAHYLEGGLLIALTVSLSYFVFVGRWGMTLPALLFFLVPSLLWSALRFGSMGAGTSGTIVAFLSVWGAAHARGPFTETAPINNVPWLQLFLLSTVVPFMFLAALVEEHRQDEQVLRESEKRFRLMADSAPVLIWMSGTDKLCTFFNQGWLKFTGRTLEQELGNGWASGVHPDDMERCLAVYSAAFDARVDFEMEYRLRRFDGDYHWVVDYGVPRFESDGTFCGYIGSCVDITVRKLSEDSLHTLSGRLIQAQEEERARISRELHDDFSQRLTLLAIGLGQLWKTLGESDVEGRAAVQEMLKKANELSSDIHALSHQLHSSRLDLVGLVSALAGLCKDISKMHEIKVHFTECDLPFKFPKDVALCLFRVAQEALGNVVKHSQANSATVELRANASGVSLRIRDDGVGFTVDRSNTGAGIGLIGMQERIRLVGGRLLVRSELRRGTEVLAEVPLYALKDDETESRAQAAGR
jgi:PAS domain S-box-containing protein